MSHLGPKEALFSSHLIRFRVFSNDHWISRQQRLRQVVQLVCSSRISFQLDSPAGIIQNNKGFVFVIGARSPILCHQNATQPVQLARMWASELFFTLSTTEVIVFLLWIPSYASSFSRYCPKSTFHGYKVSADVYEWAVCFFLTSFFSRLNCWMEP